MVSETEPGTGATAPVDGTGAEEQQLNEALRQQSLQVLRRLPALGPVIMLYLQSAHRRFQFISDLEWLLLPPLLRGQCKLYMKQDYPISFVSWAFLSEPVQQRLVQNGGRLRPEEWDSGDRLWLIDIVSPFGGVDVVLSDMRRIFSGRHLHLLAPDPATGGVIGRVLPPLDEPAADGGGAGAMTDKQ